MAYPVLNSIKHCDICGKEIKMGRRYDTMYCSPKCKQRAYIRRLKEAK